MNYLKFSIGILVVLAASRFIPHPPNFTSLIALSFYVPFFLGLNFIPVVVLSFALTDIYFGFHSVLFFTWGSVFIIGYMNKYLNKSIIVRFIGVTLSAISFFIITNFGVWLSGSYEYSIKGIIECYILALPFFGNTLISTILYSSMIETIYFIYKTYYKKLINN